MERWRSFFSSSIGRKELMGVSGLALVGFLIVHLLGNLTIYGGSSSFNGYAEKLHSVGPLLEVFELGLLLVGVLHICLAMVLTIGNLRARPRKYRGKKVEGGRSLGSRTMIFSGPYVLCFVTFHLLHFTFGSGEAPIASVVSARFAVPGWMVFYTFSMLVVGLHVSHGLWSGLQTLGLETSRRGVLRTAGIVVAVIFALGFGLLPVVVFATGDLLS